MMRALFLSVTMVGAMALPATAYAKSNSARSQVVGTTSSQTNGNSYRGGAYVSLKHEFEKGVRQFQNGNIHLAKIAFKNVMDAGDRHDTQSRAFLGLIAAERNEHKTAVLHFKAALRDNPNVYGLKAMLGLSYIELGEVEKAQSMLTHMKRKQYRHYINGSNKTEIESSIDILDRALNSTATT